MNATTTTEHAISRLTALGTELAGRGWTARLMVETGRVPCLYVRNPEPGASALSEHIYAAPRADGWLFWWSWAEPIAEDPASTADIIIRVLRSAAG